MRRLQNIIIAIILFLCLATIVAAQSQRPSPGKGILGSNNESQTSANKQYPKNDQRGTEQSPLVIKVAPSPNTQEEADQAKKDKDEKAAANRRSEIIAIAIAFATFIQAIALIVTIVVMVKTTRRQLRAYFL